MKEKKEKGVQLLKELTKYGLAGILNSLLGFVILYVQIEILDVQIFIANIINYTIGYFTNFYLNRKFTFKSKGNAKNQMKVAILVYLVSFLMQFCTILYLDEEQMHHVVSISHKIYELTPSLIIDILSPERYHRIIDAKMLLMYLGIVIFATFNFSLSRAFTFKEKK